MADLDVVVIGLNVVDAIATLPAEVRHGQKHRVEQMLLQGGGPAGNAACLLAGLGWRTGMLARLGANALSEVARTDFAAHGVRDELFIDDPEAQPAFAIVEVAPISGERTVFYSLEGYRPLTVADVPSEAIEGARLLFTDGYEPVAAIHALRIACERGIPSVVDVEDGSTDDLLTIIELATDAILPLTAGQRLSGANEPDDVLRALAKRTAGQVIVTDGERGSWAWKLQGVHHQPACRVSVVDTTGCGDAYHAGYASALIEGRPLETRMEIGAYLAGRVATHLGGRYTLGNPSDHALPQSATLAKTRLATPRTAEDFSISRAR